MIGPIEQICESHIGKFFLWRLQAWFQAIFFILKSHTYQHAPQKLKGRV